MSAAKGNSPTTVLLFDIDGTLVLTGGAGQRAMARAFEDLFAIADGFRDIPMAGRTDSWILSSAAAAHGILPGDLTRFHDTYLTHLDRELILPTRASSSCPAFAFCSTHSRHATTCIWRC